MRIRLQNHVENTILFNRESLHTSRKFFFSLEKKKKQTIRLILFINQLPGLWTADVISSKCVIPACRLWKHWRGGRSLHKARLVIKLSNTPQLAKVDETWKIFHLLFLAASVGLSFHCKNKLPCLLRRDKAPPTTSCLAPGWAKRRKGKGNVFYPIPTRLIHLPGAVLCSNKRPP